MSLTKSDKEGFSDAKKCFGHYEDDASSWHCKGCIITKECKEYQEEIICQGQIRTHTI